VDARTRSIYEEQLAGQWLELPACQGFSGHSVPVCFDIAATQMDSQEWLSYAAKLDDARR